MGRTNCVCRQGRDATGEPRRQTDVRNTCLARRGVARHLLETGAAEELSREGALALLERAERDGMGRRQPENAQDPRLPGVCCWVLLRRPPHGEELPRPADVIH